MGVDVDPKTLEVAAAASTHACLAPATGVPVTAHTAEFHVPAKDGRFLGRVGHGTDPVRHG